MVVGVGGAEELRRGGHGGHGGRRPDLRWMAGVGTVGLKMNLSRPSCDQRMRLDHTPSRGKFVKETLSFSETNPRSLAHSRKVRFRVLKAYSFSVKSKIRFQVFTVLPLGLF
jgi:hypothetical protein